MNSDTLPEVVDPIALARLGTELAGELPLAKMQTIVDLYHCGEARAKVKLRFDLDVEGFAYIHGQVATELQLQCQRCLQFFAYPIKSEFWLSPVAHIADCEKLPARYEPIMVGEIPVTLDAIIQEELLLNIPLVPKHEKMCVDLDKLTAADEGGEEKEEKVPNPFSVLAKLKKDRSSD